MQAQPSPPLNRPSGPRALERVVLMTLLDSYPAPFTDEEVRRELGCSEVAVSDAISSLVGAGLLHRNVGFVLPTRAAARFDELERLDPWQRGGERTR